jgi:hypothetical protein
VEALRTYVAKLMQQQGKPGAEPQGATRAAAAKDAQQR